MLQSFLTVRADEKICNDSLLYCHLYKPTGCRGCLSGGLTVASFVSQTMEMHRSFPHFHAVHRCQVLRHMATNTWADRTSEEMPVHSRTSNTWLCLFSCWLGFDKCFLLVDKYNSLGTVWGTFCSCCMLWWKLPSMECWEGSSGRYSWWWWKSTAVWPWWGRTQCSWWIHESGSTITTVGQPWRLSAFCSWWYGVRINSVLTLSLSTNCQVCQLVN